LVELRFPFEKKFVPFQQNKKDIFHLNSLQKVVEIAEKEFRN